MKSVITVIAFLFLICLPDILAQNESIIETSLINFHNENLACLNDYKTEIKFPIDPEIYFAWSDFVLALSKDVAICFTAGHSEVVVKTLDISSGMVDAMGIANQMANNRNKDAMGRYMMEEISEEIMQKVETDLAEKAIKKGWNKIPGWRSIFSAAVVYDTYQKRDERINSAVVKQTDFLSVIIDRLAMYQDLFSQVKAISDDTKRQHYSDVLTKMIKKRAQVDVRNSLIRAKLERGGDISTYLIKNIYSHITDPGNETSVGFTSGIFSKTSEYLQGDISDYEYDNAVKLNIQNQISSINITRRKESDVEEIFNKIKPVLSEIKNYRKELNLYSCGTSFNGYKVSKYSDLLKKLDINELSNPINISDKILNIIVFDNSGSMDVRSKTSNLTKFQEAQNAIKDIVQKSSDKFDWNLIGFEGGCGVKEFISNTNIKQELVDEIDRMSPHSGTPLARAMDFALDKFRLQKTYKKVAIIVLTDGINTCSGDPLEVAGRIKQYTNLQQHEFAFSNLLHSDLYAASSMPELLFFMIGFTTTQNENADLNKIAVTAGGQFFTAASLPQLSEKLNEIIKTLDNDANTWGIVIVTLLTILAAGGIVVYVFLRKDTHAAVLVLLDKTTGKQYRFDHKQISIGKKEGNTLVINDKKVSREHAVIQFNKSMGYAFRTFRGHIGYSR